MRLWRHVRLYLSIAAIVAVAYLVWVWVGRSLGDTRSARRQEPRQAKSTSALDPYSGTDVRILQFYAREGSLVEGRRTVLCYGVWNAKSVRIEPPLEGVSASISRCIEVAPERDTRYTLFAEGHDGRVVSESFVLAVIPDPDTLPKITSFRIAGHSINEGRHVFQLAFTAENPVEVSIDPPVFPTLHGSPYGQFYVAPRKTTTYTLTVLGKKGRKASRSLTVEVPAT